MHFVVDTDMLNNQMLFLDTEIRILERQESLWRIVQSQQFNDPNYFLLVCRQLKETEKQIHLFRLRLALLKEMMQKTNNIACTADDTLDEMRNRLCQTHDRMILR